MKHLIRLLIALLMFSPYFACIFDENLLDPFECDPISGDRSSFWVIKDPKDGLYWKDRSKWENIAVTKKEVRETVIVYTDNALEKSLNSNDKERIKNMADQFNNKIYSQVTQTYGQPYDVDENGKTIIVLTTLPPIIVNGKNLGQLAGYFNNLDFYCKNYIKEYNDQKGTVLQTNQADVIYINYTSSGEVLYQTVAHEFQHLINYSARIGSDRFMDTWIDEGLSDTAAGLCYGILTNRIDNYNSDFKNNKNDGLYYWNSTVLDYAMSYLFFQYIWAHSEKKNLFKNIIGHGDTGLGAIYYAISHDAELKKWGNTPEEIFNKIVLRWYATNAGVSNDREYNYGQDIIKVNAVYRDKLKIKNNNYYEKANLQSGGAAIVTMDKEFNNPKNGLLYLSINLDGSGEDFSGKAKRESFIVVNNNYTPKSSNIVSTDLPIGLVSTSLTMNSVLNDVPSEEKESHVSASVVDFNVNFGEE